jgi:inorganic pyrophosphatase
MSIQLWVFAWYIGRGCGLSRCFVVRSRKLISSVSYTAAPLGVLLIEDEEGNDSKIISVPCPKVDPAYSNMKQVSDIPASVSS